jgi:hypothetical protein
MELRLSPGEYPNSDISAAYLEGSVMDWFAEISFWSVDPNGMQIYLVPQDITHNACKGIFVVFNGAIPKCNCIRRPYAAVSEGFYIPADARLFPNVTPEEISRIKLWDIQFFHPAIGLVGFESQDAQALSQLVEMPAQDERVWVAALPAVRPLPQLRAVVLEQVEGLDAVDQLKSLVDVKPLSEIPESDDLKNNWSSGTKKIFKPLINLGIWILLILAFMGKFILQLIGFLLPRAVSAMANRATPGFLQQLEGWINKRMDALEKQRDTELNRLVKLFDKDKDLALQYAIPLSSAYLDRGKARSSGKLTRRSLNFNFNNFGFRGAADAWDIGNYQWVLRQKYEKAATDAIAEGDYKRAAYIYAHLLADFSRAAKALVDGKHYREAAAIYKDHLKNMLHAAQCLEKGGLLNEAIDLYIKLEHYETVGNLYVLLGQGNKATKYFEEVIASSMKSGDHLRAAQVIESKFGDLERCQAVLLEGWNDNNKAELCLARYFKIAEARGLPLIPAVTEFYGSHVRRTNDTIFLYVLADLAAASESKELKDEALNICYQIVHRQTSYGDFSALKMLGRFMPEDRLVSQDVHRYAIKHEKKIRRQPVNYQIRLEAGTVWKDFVVFHDQLLGVGSNGKMVRLLRMNWDRKEEYSYLADANAYSDLVLLADPGVSEMVLVVSSEISNREVLLKSSSFFERAVALRQVNWITKDNLGSTPDPNGNICVLKVQGEEVLLQTHDLTGKVLSFSTCTLNGHEALAGELLFSHSKLYWRKDHIYFAGMEALFRVNDIGAVECLNLESSVLSFSVSNAHAALKIAVLTLDGCLVILPSFNGMEIGIPLFGADFSAGTVQLLPNNYLVLAAARKARVYEIGDNEAKLLFEVDIDQDIVKVIPVPRRGHFALIGLDNRISVFVIPEDL